ncbi:MAG: sigma-70 family RNA polymerase sigma factor [Patescibacteria group bacterium]|nr:sigma-70 family RNA polymerase sigma factor [Patescibacteria group bacterium]
MLMTQNRSDKQLIADYLAGDEPSLEVLIQQYLKPIYSFVYRYVGNMDNTEDITQEVFARMWKNIKKFDPKRKFKTWLFSIAKNAAIDFLRKKKTIPFSEFFAQGRSAFDGKNEEGENMIYETLSDPAPLPDELLERADIAQMLASAMDKLSPKYRMVIFLRYNDHFTFHEIAESLEEPLNTVKSRHRRALVKLRQIITKSA